MQTDLFQPTSITVRVEARSASEAKAKAAPALGDFDGFVRLEWFTGAKLHWLTMKAEAGADTTPKLRAPKAPNRFDAITDDELSAMLGL